MGSAHGWDYTFEVNGKPFFQPHVGAQMEILRRLEDRVMRGVGASKKFLRGKRGGGKSYLLRRGFLHRMALAIPGLKYTFVRRNMPDLRSNHLIYLGQEMRALGGQYHETFGQALYHNGSMGFYRQCEEERDVEKIVGSESDILVVDEAPQIKWEFLRLMSPSVRASRGAGGQTHWTLEVYSGNPIGESIDELDKYCLEKDVSALEDPEYNPDDWECLTIHLEDNPSLDPQEYRKQFAGLPLHYRKAWLDGERVEDRVLFDVHKTVTRSLLTQLGETPRVEPLPESMVGKPYHYIQELPRIDGVPLLQVPWIQVYRGFDGGFFPDPAVAVWLAVVGRRVIAVSEGTWFKTIAKDLAAKMIEQHEELVGETPCAMTYADPHIGIQTASDVVTVRDVLEAHGVPIELSISDRMLYADAIHGLLGEEVEPGVPRFQVYEPGCPMLAKYLPKMRWDEKNPRKMADHKFDHWVCALAYFAISSGVLAVSAKEETRGEPVWMAWIREAETRKSGPRGRMRV